jgi:hypothetical protein
VRQAGLRVRTAGAPRPRPQYNMTWRIGGKAVNVYLKPGPELEKAEREVAEPQRFMGLMEERSRRISALLCQTMSDYGKPCYDPGHGHRPGTAGPPSPKSRTSCSPGHGT